MRRLSRAMRLVSVYLTSPSRWKVEVARTGGSCRFGRRPAHEVFQHFCVLPLCGVSPFVAPNLIGFPCKSPRALASGISQGLWRALTDPYRRVSIGRNPRPAPRFPSRPFGLSPRISPSTRRLRAGDADFEYFVRLAANPQSELIPRIMLSDRKLHVVHRSDLLIVYRCDDVSRA